MLSMERTRILVDGKELKNVKGCFISLDFVGMTQNAMIQFKDESLPPSLVNVQTFDVVEENAQDKNKETVTWTQIVCNKIF